ncbi:protein SOSEKI 5-like isoform X1 [Salvia splendens]|uniref:protein SOSEKI 5-like isoform X1 n=1 Tax=Salvia splendens TaxID=180675 RepID=UPI001C272283|nr:protein SOSEKI 5-like isoform X1 [Salvia splendens]
MTSQLCVIKYVRITTTSTQKCACACVVLSVEEWTARPPPFHGGSPLLSPRPFPQRCDQPLECTSRQWNGLHVFLVFQKVTTIIPIYSFLLILHFIHMNYLIRSYKNGFVWHDLSEDDLIIPAHGHDYILKGSAFLNPTSAQDYSRRRNQSCSSIDFDSKSADVSTQTEDNRRGSQPDRLSDSKELEIEISPPPSDSRPETLGTLLKADGQVRLRPETASHRHHHFQRCRSSMVLMQLISCGSMPFRDCGTGSDQGMVGRPRKLMAPRGTGGKLGLEEKEYFSGSIVETNKREFPALKRSSSYNADRWRSLNLEVAEK